MGVSHSIAKFGFCSIIALAPLPFGSTDIKVVAVWVILLGIATVLAGNRQYSMREIAILVGLAIVVACWAFVVIQQMASPPFLADILVDPIWRQASRLLDEHLTPSVAVALNQPYFAAGAQITCVLSLTCGLFLGQSRTTAHTILNVFAISGLAYATFGIVSFILDPTHVLWRLKASYVSSLTATFTNRNTAAVYLGSCAIAWALMLANSIGKPSEPNAFRKFMARRLFFAPSRRTITCACAFLIVIAAMFMTSSRAGVTFSLAMLAGALLTFFRSIITASYRSMSITLLVLPAAFLAIFEIFGSKINQRFEVGGLSDVGRIHVYESTLAIIRDHPWLGTGLGTFVWVFPRYRSADISALGIWDRAHSTPLELAAEMGLPFGVVVIIGWSLMLYLLANGMSRRKRDQILPMTAFWIGMLAMTHSLIDFSLQIPAVSIIVLGLIGMGLAQSASPRTRLPSAKMRLDSPVRKMENTAGISARSGMELLT